MGILRAAWKILTSVRLALVLIALIVVMAGMSTLVPQGMSDAWYTARYTPVVAAIIRALRLGTFFGSALFLGPAVLFCLNLALCTVRRCVSRARSHAPWRPGPDLIHVGLIVLVAGGLVTALGRQERTLTLVEGDEASLGSGYHLALRSLQFQANADGSPRDWISTVGVTREGRPEVKVVPIRVNHPMRLPGITVYQAAWDVRGTLHMHDRSGRDVEPPNPGDYFPMGDSRWVFDGFVHDGPAWSAAFARYRDDELLERRTLKAGDSIGPFTVVQVDAHDRSGLKVVHDPGLAPFLAALILFTAGLGLTFIQKEKRPVAGDAAS